MAQERQPTRTRAVGTDLNRNWSHQWRCCGASSATPFSQLVLWPYGYTRADTAPGLATDDQMARAAIGRDMAATNRYTPEQASDLYIADGTIIDWLRGTYKIFTYTLEMYPRSSSPGFYPPDEVIARETARNRKAVLRLLEISDCPYRAIGKETQYCGLPSSTVFADDFEGERGWTITGGAGAPGAWQRADPQPTNFGGRKQLGTTTSGIRDLVTGAAAGASARANDLDGGATVATSPQIALPAGGRYRLTLAYYLAHRNNATIDDHLQVRVIGATTATVLDVRGAPADRDAVWRSASASLDNFAGQIVPIVIQAADAGTGSLVEAAVDDVRISRL